jgi:hypothetical protein
MNTWSEIHNPQAFGWEEAHQYLRPNQAGVCRIYRKVGDESDQWYVHWYATGRTDRLAVVSHEATPKVKEHVAAELARVGGDMSETMRRELHEEATIGWTGFGYKKGL